MQFILERFEKCDAHKNELIKLAVDHELSVGQ